MNKFLGTREALLAADFFPSAAGARERVEAGAKVEAKEVVVILLVVVVVGVEDVDRMGGTIGVVFDGEAVVVVVAVGVRIEKEGLGTKGFQAEGLTGLLLLRLFDEGVGTLGTNGADVLEVEEEEEDDKGGRGGLTMEVVEGE